MKFRLGSWTDAQSAIAAVLAATIIIAFQLAGKATRDALFLSTFGAAGLPPMVIAAAVLSAVLSVLLARVMAQSRPGRVVPRLFALSALLLLAEWFLTAQARRPTAILVYLHFTALGAILVSGFWAIINERFDPRTARRAIGRITAGGSIGGLLGGVLPERVGAALSLTAMLPILAVLHLAAAALVLGVQQGTPSLSASELQQEPDPVLRGSQVLRASPYLMGLGLLVALTSTAEGVLDYVFKARATAATPSGEQLLRLFAAFYTATALLGIFVQVTALRRLLGNLGIARSASLLPAGVAAGSVGAFIVPVLGPIMAVRGLEVVLRNSLFRAAYELLFTPVAPQEKRATKLLLDVGAARVGDVAGGLIILGALVTGAAAGRVLLVMTFALSVGALLVARRLHRGYVGALEGTLQRRAGELPDPIRDDAAALLQTVGAFDISGIRSRLTISTDSPYAAESPPRPSTPAQAPQTTLERAINEGQAGKVREALEEQALAPDQIETAIELLAWDAVASNVIRSLAAVAPANSRTLLRHLLDPNEDFAIRRRLVNVLADRRSVEVFDGLFLGLSDSRFEVRYRIGRVLSRMAGNTPGARVDQEAVLRVVQREIGVGRGVWESRQLIDAMDEESSPMQTELLRDRADRSLEHLFNLLSLILPRETLRLAFHSLHTDDRYLRGTALEYLETVLPESLWTTLRPLLEPGEVRARSRRPSEEVLKELLASRESINLAISRADARPRRTPHSGPAS